MANANDLTGEIALVTGASRGIGQCIALALGKLGDKTAQGVSLMHYLRFLGGSLGNSGTFFIRSNSPSSVRLLVSICPPAITILSSIF